MKIIGPTYAQTRLKLCVRVGLKNLERCEYDNLSTVLFDAFLKPLASHHRIGSHVTFRSTWRPQKGWIWNPPIQHEIRQVIGHRGVIGATACNNQCHWHIEDGSLYRHLIHSPSIATRIPDQTALWNISATWRIPKMVIKAFAGHNSCPGIVQKKQELQGVMNMNIWGPQTVST